MSEKASPNPEKAPAKETKPPRKADPAKAKPLGKAATKNTVDKK